MISSTFLTVGGRLPCRSRQRFHQPLLWQRGYYLIQSKAFQVLGPEGGGRVAFLEFFLRDFLRECRSPWLSSPTEPSRSFKQILCIGSTWDISLLSGGRYSKHPRGEQKSEEWACICIIEALLHFYISHTGAIFNF